MINRMRCQGVLPNISPFFKITLRPPKHGHNIFILRVMRCKKIFLKKMSGTYFFQGRKLDFSFVSVFCILPSNLVPDARGPPTPLFWPQTTQMGLTKIPWQFGKKIGSLPGFGGGHGRVHGRILVTRTFQKRDIRYTTVVRILYT